MTHPTTLSLGGELRQTWRTPPALFTALNDIFHFDVDACAQADDALLPDWWSDCMSADWTGRRIWCNPPWHLGRRGILAKAPDAQLAIVLLPQTCLITQYLAANPPDWLMIPQVRIRFIPPPGLERSRPPMGSVALAYGASEEEAARVEEQLGWSCWRHASLDKPGGIV